MARKPEKVNVEVHWTYSKELSFTQERAWKKFWGKLLRDDRKLLYINNENRLNEPSQCRKSEKGSRDG